MSEYSSLNSDSDSLSPRWNELDKENHIQVPFHLYPVNHAKENDVHQPIGFHPPRTTRAKGNKKRTIFTADQRSALEKSFKDNNFLTPEEKLRLSRTLCLKEPQIKIWFQNQRMKYRKAEARNKAVVHTKSTSDVALAPMNKAIQNPNQISIDVALTAPTDEYNQQTAWTGPAQGGPMVDISHNLPQIDHQYYTGPCHYPVQNFVIPQQSMELVGGCAEGFNNECDNSYELPFYSPDQSMHVHQPASVNELQYGQHNEMQNGPHNYVQNILNGQSEPHNYLQNILNGQSGPHNYLQNLLHNVPQNELHPLLRDGSHDGLQTGFNQYNNAAENFSQIGMEEYCQNFDVSLSTHVANVVGML